LASDLYIYKHTFPLEPNRASWGFDAGSEPVRREAIERAIATGDAEPDEKEHFVRHFEVIEHDFSLLSGDEIVGEGNA